MSASAPESYVPHGLEELRTYGEGFAGREAELAALDRAWCEGTHVFVLHAEGGAGKTRVVAKWLTQTRDAGWRGAGRCSSIPSTARGATSGATRRRRFSSSRP